MAKFVFITGGVVSGLGKGLTAASIALLLRRRGFRVAIQKMDPYLNLDAAGLDPARQGGPYYTDDGFEGDVDLGHYERIADVPLDRRSHVTTGQIYQSVIARERAGDYGTDLVQLVPHVTDAIVGAFTALGDDPARPVDFVLVELGGTVGDMEGTAYIEAFRQFRMKHAADTMFIHLTFVPHLRTSGETKTKPTQHSVQKLREQGIQADLLICRADLALNFDREARRKLALFCNVRPERIVIEPNVDSTEYEIPLFLREQDVDGQIVRHFGLSEDPAPDLTDWAAMVDAVKKPAREIRVALVADQAVAGLRYKPVLEALIHAGAARNARIVPVHTEAETLARLSAAEADAALAGVDAILVPGSPMPKGPASVDGMIRAARYARERQVPFLGIGLGLHCAVVEFARHVLGHAGATSLAWTPAASADDAFVTPLTPDLKPQIGRRACALTPGTRAARVYGDASPIHERFANRYAVAPDKLDELARHGLIVSGMDTDTGRAAFVELAGHPFFVATQAHPEYASRPTRPHPLYLAFLDAAPAREGRG